MDNKDTLFNEQELLQRLNAGDKHAFTRIYEQYASKLYRYALKFVKSEEIAEDVVHDIFVKLWNNAATLTIETSLQAYLYKTTHHHLLNLIKREAVQERYLGEMINTAAQFNRSTEESVDFKETMQKVQQAVDSLPPQRKLIFEMGRTGGMTHSQIARELNIAGSTVNNQIVKALRTIKEHLTASGALALIPLISLLIKK